MAGYQLLFFGDDGALAASIEISAISVEAALHVATHTLENAIRLCGSMGWQQPPSPVGANQRSQRRSEYDAVGVLTLDPQSLGPINLPSSYEMKRNGA
jgi:hypothetical protein